MSLTYYAGKTDVQYRVEISSDLQSWTTSGITLSAPDKIQFSQPLSLCQRRSENRINLAV